MSARRIRPTFLLALCGSKETTITQNGHLPLLAFGPGTLSQRRSLHNQPLTKNIRYISNDDLKIKADSSTLKLNKTIDKPLCILMNWMMAKPKHLERYAKLYTDRGFDAITVSCSPWQLLWPAKGSQVIGKELLKFLESNDNRALVVHGFSVGAYVWSELLVHTTADKQRYQPVLDRIKAQVWDSPADIHEIPVGFPSAVFPRNKVLEESFRFYIKTHMRICHIMATRHYMKGTEVFHATPCKAPGLFLVSKTDPVGVAHRSRHAADCWEKLGIKCNFKCWDKSPHVQHYIHHPEEYKAALYDHLQQCKILPTQSS